MARIAGIDLPREKRVEIALTYIFGIGRKSANDILKLASVNPDTRVKDLTEDQEAASCVMSSIRTTPSRATSAVKLL